MGKYKYGNAIMEIYRADKNINRNIENIKKNGVYNEYINCVSIMCAGKLFGEVLRKIFEIADVNDLISESTFPILLGIDKEYVEDDFYKDILFMEAFFEVNKKHVTDFLQLKDKFEHEFLNGKRENAESTLFLIQQRYGMSFWLIESRLLLYNDWNYKKYTDFYLEIRDSCKNELLKNHIRLIKRRINLRTRTIEYEHFFLENIEEYCYCDEWSYKFYGYYTRFMSFETHRKLSDDMKKSLGVMLYHLSFVDTWILFKRLTVYLCVFDRSKGVTQLSRTYRKNFSFIDEERGNIYHRLKKSFCESLYEECLEECEKVLSENGNHFEILDLYIKCLFLTEKKRILQPEDSPLLKLSDVLVKCYIKEDDSDYAFTYIDYCDRYSRALSMFSSYYELLGIVENTMEPMNEKSKWSLFIKLFDRNFPNEESACFQIKEKINEISIDSRWENLYVCEWNYEFRKIIRHENFQSDEIAMKLGTIDEEENLVIRWGNKMSNLDRLYYEEYVVNKFQKYVEREKYIDAIHLFVDVYIKSTFLVLKMDVEKLETRLCNTVRLSMLDEIDYFIFLDIGRKRREEKNVFDQAMVDSFESILKKRHITKPSDIIPLGEEPTDNILMFWEGCCNRLLNESPCDLYDEEELDEKILLLNRIIRKKPRALYKEWLAKLELDKDYSGIIKLYGKEEWITDKIIADEIIIENDENIMSHYNELCGLSMQQILENDEKVSTFKEVFAHSKKEYIKQVNEQMGSRIRHSILDTEFVQLLKNYSLFLPLCNDEEKTNILISNRYILERPFPKRESIYIRLQKCCIELFENIALAKKELIYFTHEEKYLEHTSLYITLEELKQYMHRIEDISNVTRFINALKEMLDSILVERLYILRDKVRNRLENIQEQYITSIKCITEQEDLNVNVLCLEKEMGIMINKIVAWFNLFSNGERQYDLKTYLNEQAQKYSDIIFINAIKSDTHSSIKLKHIRDIDMILKNLVHNVQIHSGYATNLYEANAKFVISLDASGHFSLKTSNRVILPEDKINIDAKLDDINKPHTKRTLSDDYKPEEGKGKGYKSIKKVLINNYFNPIIKVEINNDVFEASIDFDLEREQDEFFNC